MTENRRGAEQATEWWGNIWQDREPLPRTYIVPGEQEDVRRLVETSLGVDLPELLGDGVAVKLFVREEDLFRTTDSHGKDITVILPESVRCHDASRHHAALVIAVGPACPDDGVQVGDFVLIPRHEGVEMLWQDTVIRILSLSALYGVIQNPRQVTGES
jgi:hypothetical protein